MTLYELDGVSPRLADDGSCYVAPGARVIGRVRLGRQSSVWFNAVIRGDNETIDIGEGANIQDGAILHADPGYPVTVGPGCTVGHGAILHGCTLEEHVLVGMGAVLLNGARIGKNAIVGAGALVAEGKSFPGDSLILGVPAKLVRPLTAEELERTAGAHLRYIGHAARYRQELSADKG